MADKELDDLDPAGDLVGTETMYCVKGGNSRRTDPDNILKKGALRFDQAQSLTDAQKSQARGNFGGGAPDALLEDQKGSGTNGGTATHSTWITRDLNTVQRNINSVLSLSSNQFTPSVDGWVCWSCPAYDVDRHSTRLFNITDGVAVSSGTSEYTSAAFASSTTSFGGGIVEAGKTYEIQHITQESRSSNGLGVSAIDQASIYSRLEFWRT